MKIIIERVGAFADAFADAFVDKDKDKVADMDKDTEAEDNIVPGSSAAADKD